MCLFKKRLYIRRRLLPTCLNSLCRAPQLLPCGVSFLGIHIEHKTTKRAPGWERRQKRSLGVRFLVSGGALFGCERRNHELPLRLVEWQALILNAFCYSPSFPAEPRRGFKEPRMKAEAEPHQWKSTSSLCWWRIFPVWQAKVECASLLLLLLMTKWWGHKTSRENFTSHNQERSPSWWFWWCSV